ncbi:hypothetical protein SSX86_003012 [Deinandra increscens subsp. villosa]|uniref:Uncharacterized protein n=1 Tax=Deinandra increscens subsp. villosa TaxID=3103831 RepID=A0AAP0DP65_9ASTR
MDDGSAKISVLLSDASLITMTGVRCFNLITIDGFSDVNILPTPIANLIHTKWLLTVNQGRRITDSLLELRGTGVSPVPIAVVKPGEPVTHDIGTSEDRWEPGIDLSAERQDVSSSQGSHDPGVDQAGVGNVAGTGTTIDTAALDIEEQQEAALDDKETIALHTDGKAATTSNQTAGEDSGHQQQMVGSEMAVGNKKQKLEHPDV